jgi:hypothetical protein
MQTKFIATLIIALLNIFLGFYILRKNYKNPNNIFYAGLCISGGIWALSMAALLVANSQVILDKVVMANYIFGILPPYFYLMFAYYYPYKLWNYSASLIKTIYLIPVFFIFLLLSRLIVLEDANYFNGLISQRSIFPNFLVFVVYFFIYILVGLCILLKKMKRIEGIYKINIKYLIIATLSTFIFTGIVSVFLLMLNVYTYDWLGPIFMLIHFVVVGYLLFYKSK